MRFRTKILLSFGAIWLFIALAGRSWYIVETQKILFEQKMITIQSLAAGIAASISGDNLQKAPTELLNIQKAIQQSGVDFKSVDLLLTYQGEIDMANGDYSAIAPIYDSQHNLVANLVLTVQKAVIQQDLKRMLNETLFSATTMMLVGLVFLFFMSRLATRPLERILQAVEEIGRGNLHVTLPVTSKDAFGKLCEGINNMERDLEQNVRLKLNFTRYVSKNIMEKILSSDAPIELKGERRKITVLFSDIRHFTTLSEKLPPEEVVSLLNEFLGHMLNIIFNHRGTLDKFLGDGLMVEYGAPLEDPEQEKNAVDTAIAMQRETMELNKKWMQERSIQLQIGIGIHTGQAVVGDIGSEMRMEYTAIGDTVNVASMLEQETKRQNGKILISKTTASKLDDSYKAKSLGELSLPGREALIEVFTIDA